MVTQNKTINRLLSLVLCLCMVLTLLPMLPMEAEAATPQYLYLVPNSNWKEANARFAIYLFGNGETWVSGTKLANGMYQFKLPTKTYPNVIFCRMNPSASGNNWDNKWNQTGDLTVPTNGNNCYTVKSGTWDKGGGTWSKYDYCGEYGHTTNKDNTCQWCGVTFTTCQLNGHSYEGDTCSVCQAGLMTVYFRNDWFWSNVSVYYWLGAKGVAAYNNAWPGAKMELYGNDGEHDYYVAKLPTDVMGVIINGIQNGTTSTPDQSPDITSGWYDGVCYYMHWDDGNKVSSININTVKFPCKHTKTEAIPGSDATCTADGLTEGIKCSDCDEILQKQETIPAKGHDYKSEITTAPGCESEGVETFTCANCGDSYTKPVSATGHSYNAVVTAPNCEKGGYTTYTCGTCGHSYVADKTEALGHKWSDATCDAPKTCSVCGATEGDALGHSYSAEITTAPGCETTGVKTYTCGNCGDVYTEPLAATGHSYKSEVTAPDCINGGYTTYTCGACGHSYVADETDALGHDYKSEITTAPGCESEGVETFTCANCGDSYTKPVSATGHSYKTEVTAPDCINGGYTTYTCACGHSYVADKTEALGHTAEVVPGYAADCTNTGLTDGSKCAVCGETLIAQEIIPATGIHADADKNYRCDSCNKLMQDAQLAKVSVSLKGNIAVNYYMLLTAEVAADRNAYMYFKLVDGEVKIPATDGVKMVLDGETYYVYTCAVDAKEMTDNIVSQFFYGNNVTREHTYNVQTYGKHILAAYDDQATRDLITAMLNYGAASQLHFGYNTDKLANDVRDDKGNALIAAPDYSDVTIDGFQAVAGQGTELAKFYSASLILKSETTVRFFFQVNADATFTASYNGQELTVSKRGSLHYVDVVGISAKDLGEAVTITINDGTNTTEVSFNPMSYCQGVLNDTTGAFSNEMKDLVCALYLYNQAANVYFEEV